MELIFYFLFVAAAITGVALLLNRLGQGKQARYSVEEARGHLLAAYPDKDPGEPRDAEGAILFALPEKRIAIIRSMGKFPLVKILAGADVLSIGTTEDEVKLRTRDFADPLIHLKSDDPAGLRLWIESQIR